MEAVSYTHLDVYKRQPHTHNANAMQWTCLRASRLTPSMTFISCFPSKGRCYVACSLHAFLSWASRFTSPYGIHRLASPSSSIPLFIYQPVQSFHTITLPCVRRIQCHKQCYFSCPDDIQHFPFLSYPSNEPPHSSLSPSRKIFSILLQVHISRAYNLLSSSLLNVP